METKIKWNEGDGYITATYEGSGSGSASISSDVNEGIDREQSIKVETTDKSVSATLVVSQEGLREVLTPSDGEFVLADGGTFNVLKDKKTKIVNRAYVAKRTTTSGIESIKSSITGKSPAYFEYPVTSDVFIIFDGAINLLVCQNGNSNWMTTRFWNGLEITSWSPVEDDTYIYEIIVE